MITVYKNRRILEYRQGKRLILTCPVSLGFQLDGHKQCEGDGRTPEGRYRICSKNSLSKFCFSFGISYPSSRDARAALSERRISMAQALRIMIPSFLHLRPCWSTPLGGFIMLHGESPEGKTGDWTQGCIAISNEDIKKLASHVRKGEIIEILP